MSNCLILSLTLGLIVGTSMTTKQNELTEDWQLNGFERMELSRTSAGRDKSQSESIGITFTRILGGPTQYSSVRSQVANLLKQKPAIQNADAMITAAKKIFAAPYVTSVTFLESVSGEFGFGKSHHRPSEVTARFNGKGENRLIIRAKFKDSGSPAFTTFKVDLNGPDYPFTYSQTAQILNHIAGTKVPDDIVGLVSWSESQRTKTKVIWNQDGTEGSLVCNIREVELDEIKSRGKIFGPNGEAWVIYETDRRNNRISGEIIDLDRQALHFTCDLGINCPGKEHSFTFEKDRGISTFGYSFTPEHFQELAQWMFPEKGEMHFEEKVLEELMADLSNTDIEVIFPDATEKARTPKRLIL